MSSCFKVFHSELDKSRESDYRKATGELKKHHQELETPTVTIRNSTDYARWKTPGLTFDPNGYSLDGKIGWRWGELGIWHSNYYAWRNLAESSYDYAILCEDDVVIDTHWLNETLSLLPPDYEIFHAWPPGDQSYRFSTSMLVNEHVSHIYQDWSMLSYVITRDAARKAITMTKNIDQPIDWWFFRHPYRFRQYTTPPNKSQIRHSEKSSTFQLSQARIRIDELSK